MTNVIALRGEAFKSQINKSCVGEGKEKQEHIREYKISVNKRD
jgi:hypothetical protein